MDNDWSAQFKSLLASPIGRELVRVLTEGLHNSIIEDAEKAGTAETAYGLLKEARGVIKAVEHLNSIAAFAPKDQGSKAK